jgi:hypothetical protein
LSGASRASQHDESIEMLNVKQNLMTVVGAMFFVAMIAATYALSSGAVTAKVAGATQQVAMAGQPDGLSKQS